MWVLFWFLLLLRRLTLGRRGKTGNQAGCYLPEPKMLLHLLHDFQPHLQLKLNYNVKKLEVNIWILHPKIIFSVSTFIGTCVFILLDDFWKTKTIQHLKLGYNNLSINNNKRLNHIMFKFLQVLFCPNDEVIKIRTLHYI